MIQEYDRSVLLQRGTQGEILTTDELLFLCSRTFYDPIKLLEIGCGEKEKSKREIVRVAYNLARFADTIEDGTLTFAQKDDCLNKFTYILNEIDQRGDSKGLEELLAQRIPEVADMAVQGTRTPEEKIFIQQAKYPPFFTEFLNCERLIRENLITCVTRMTNGMTNFLERGEIQTIQEGKNYCFYVAGGVGIFLNRAVKQQDGIELNDDQAKALGEYLQMTNIIKGMHNDWKERRVYLPAEIHTGTSMDFVIQSEGLIAKGLREKCLEQMIGIARENQQQAKDYVASIPSHLPGYQAFCLIPYIAAEKTLAHMEHCGAEKVFSGNIEAIKLPREKIENIMKFAYGLTQVPDIKRTAWITNYLANPDKFSFKTANYTEWAPELLTD